ncbi:MAG: hypothetical protein HQL95_00525 [Magnetococcales bacterium]|nr:hypothetical protein [Magnetococcales bacterium]
MNVEWKNFQMFECHHKDSIEYDDEGSQQYEKCMGGECCRFDYIEKCKYAEFHLDDLLSLIAIDKKNNKKNH